jgi:predicted nucleic acid-binding protein
VVVLDSSFLIAYHNPREAHHAAAARAMVQFLNGTWGEGLLPEYVFLEVVTVLRARVGAGQATAAGRALLEARELRFMPCAEVFVETWALFQRAQAELSFADAAIATLALRHAEGKVLTFDRDFQQVDGLTVLPASL